MSVKWGQITPSEMMPVRCDRQGLALGKARPKLLASVLVLVFWVHLLSQTHKPCSRCAGRVEAAEGLGAPPGGIAAESVLPASLRSTPTPNPHFPSTNTHDLGSTAGWGGPSGTGIFPSEGGGPCGFLPGDFRQRGLGPQRGRGDDTVVPQALRGGQHGSLQHGGSR